MSFENLEVWKRAARLSVTLYQETQSLEDFGFRGQLTRGWLSIPSNIAEGHGHGVDAEMARFLAIANGSAAELRTQILIGIEVGNLEREAALEWADEAPNWQHVGRSDQTLPFERVVADMYFSPLATRPSQLTTHV
jgi:four helix bundle protein